VALELAATLAAGSCAVAAAFGLARIAPVPGLVGPPKAARSVDAAAFTALLWSVALVVATTRFVSEDLSHRLGPLTLDYATTAASIGSLLVLIAACWRVRVLRQLELGIADRADAAVALSVTSLAVAVPLAAIDVAAPDRILPAALLVASASCLWSVLTPDPARVSIVMRGTVAVMLLGVPTALMVAILAQQAGEHGAVVALLGCAASIVVGLIARNVARPLGPEQSRWLMAIAEASERALVPEPRAAIVETLRALKKTSKRPDAIPQLWRLDPPVVVDVDVAGYLHEKPAEFPEGLCALGLDEPERTLRTESLESLQVRRPEVRPLLAWFSVRGAFSATIVLDDDGPLGFLLLPRGDRTARMSLEEARAARQLADRISGLVAVTSALARSRKREAEAEREAEQWQRRAESAERVVEGEGLRQRRLARSLARRVLSAAYSPAMRVTLTDVEHAATKQRPVALLAPTGTDTKGWAAVTHLATPDCHGPLLCVDAGLSEEMSLQLWSDSDRSPLTLAAGGTLFIDDLHLMPLDVQTHLVQELTSTDPAPRMPRLVVGLKAPLSALIRDGAVHPALASILGQEAIELPTLEQRAEDLRALILDAISRVPSKEPKGVDRRALQSLMDAPWPGNERQLFDVVERATRLSDGPLVTLESLSIAGFATPAVGSAQIGSLEPDPHTRVSSPPRRRPRAPRRSRHRS
jgi:transcriptional regulator with AAA-type ATPase domain